MELPANSFCYSFPLIDMDDVIKITAITKRFENEKRLITVEMVTHDFESAMLNLVYVNDKSTTKDAYSYMKFLVEEHALCSIKIHIRA